MVQLGAVVDVHAVVNAGALAATSWVQDAEAGGGRIVGEVCHFIDFLQFMSGSYPISVFANSISGDTGKYLKSDNLCLQIKFADGSVGNIVYAACGSKVFSRERVEVFGEESAMVIDDFKTALLIKGIKKAAVFPVPVSAMPTTSRPAKIGPIAWFWIGVGIL